VLVLRAVPEGPVPPVPAAPTIVYTFSVKAADAEKVCLAGDFNQWRVCDAALTRVEEDFWSISLELPKGRYEYMFVVDGNWVTDPNAIGHVDDGFGNKNAVLVL
jgi:1,4-alpha-glucan branching enzyme